MSLRFYFRERVAAGVVKKKRKREEEIEEDNLNSLKTICFFETNLLRGAEILDSLESI